MLIKLLFLIHLVTCLYVTSYKYCEASKGSNPGNNHGLQTIGTQELGRAGIQSPIEYYSLYLLTPEGVDSAFPTIGNDYTVKQASISNFNHYLISLTHSQGIQSGGFIHGINLLTSALFTVITIWS